MPEFPYVQGGVVRTIATANAANSFATTLTAAGSVNTKGTAVELSAATEFDAGWVLVTLSDHGAAATFLTDVMIGASTEQVIIPNLFSTCRGGLGDYGSYLFRMFIPKGSRITARTQSSSASFTLRIAITLFADSMLSGSGSGPSWVAEYGATATSLGTNVDPGAVANTDVTTEITASTVRNHSWLCVAARFGDGTLAAATAWRWSLCAGSATEEKIIPDIHVSGDATSDLSYSPVICVPCFVPSGSRLSIRMRSSVATDGDRDAWFKVYGC